MAYNPFDNLGLPNPTQTNIPLPPDPFEPDYGIPASLAPTMPQQALQQPTTNPFNNVGLKPLVEPLAPVQSPIQTNEPSVSANPPQDRLMTNDDLIKKPATQTQPTQQRPAIAQKKVITGKEYSPNLLNEVESSFNGMMSTMSKLVDTKVVSEEEMAPYMKAVANYAAHTDMNVDGTIANDYFKKVEKTKSDIRDVYAEMKSITAQEIDPDRYIKKMSGAAKLGAVLEAAFRSWMTVSGKKNLIDGTSWADQIKQAARDDVNFQFNELKSKKEGVGTKYNMLNDELKRHGDEVNAKLGMESKLIAAAGAKLDSILKQKNLTEGQRLEVKAEQEKLKYGVALNLLQMTGRGYTLQQEPQTSRMPAENLFKTRQDIRGRLMAVPKFNDKNEIMVDSSGSPVLDYRVADSKEGLGATKKGVIAGVSAIQQIDELLELQQTALSLKDKVNPNSELMGEIKARAKTLMMNLKNFYELGAITAPDLEILNDIIGDPTAVIFSDKFKGTVAGFKNSVVNDLDLGVRSGAPLTVEEYTKQIYGEDLLPTILNKDFMNDLKFRKSQTFSKNQKAYRNKLTEYVDKPPESMKESFFSSGFE